jgi:translation initiation factor IF-1
MPKADFIRAEGTVIKMQGHGFYLVRLDDNDHEILARMSGRMAKNKIRVIQLDRVELEISRIRPHADATGAGAAASAALRTLTPRETEVLRLVAAGLSNAEIGPGWW